MPLPFIADAIFNGPPEWMPDPWLLLKIGVAAAALFLLKCYCDGTLNTSERKMHGRVIMITGGTSGIGAATALELASRGAQIVLLTHLPPSDPFLVDHVEDLRNRSENELVYAEQVDLSSLHSIRKFATKWIDNAPPRRLDMIILCAATLTPPGQKRRETDEGIEETWMVNYLANFHLLSILSPALKAQPFDRDVRVIIASCSSYIKSPPLSQALDKKAWTPSKAYARSKLALMVFGKAFQQHLDAYKRPDQLPMSAKVIFVDPGYSRTPGMRRWLTRGSILGLVFYLWNYLFAWFLLKSPEMGAQSFVYAAMESSLIRPPGAKLIKECRAVDYARTDINDEEIAKQLWEASDKLIEKTEKTEATKRALKKKEDEKREKEAIEAEKAKEVESLVGAIKKGKEADKAKSRRQKKAAKAAES